MIENGKLIGQEGVMRGKVLSLKGAESWQIGRDPDLCQIAIADPLVSRLHCRITATAEGYLMENLSETNPAQVNGRQLFDPYLLKEGDIVKIGGSLFAYSTKEETTQSPPPPEEEEEVYEAIFGTVGKEAASPKVDVTQLGRYLLKVVTGPNTGAEVTLHPGRSYLLGTDANVCDIVFHDLSVSRQHARITVRNDETLEIEDLHSRNGVIVDGKVIDQKGATGSNAVVSLGTTSFVIIDKEEAQETLFTTAAPLSAPAVEMEEEEVALIAPAAVAAKKEKPVLSGGTFILLVAAIGIIVMVVAGSLSLFQTNEVVVPRRDYDKEINKAVANFKDVRFTYNSATGNLLLLGHVLTPVERAELMYNLQGLKFIGNVENNVVVDQYVWEQYNAVIGKNPDWRGVSLYAPEPGKFVISGYLLTQKQAATLQDYLRLNFIYLDRLENQVVVEEILMEEIKGQLIQGGFSGVTPQLSNGELVITGYISKGKARQFEQLAQTLKALPGIRIIKNYVVLLTEEQSVIDLTGKFQVQGFSKHDDTIVNVLIDGRILMRGDRFQGMEVVSIKSNTVILEKNGVKYKISYNQ
ncbi:MAG: type III secretion system inner membrane ring subunit SctD [Verrucomicrobia bacterium]|nr:type III secretion system inner membrane ring subunit SctD [Verrucomicrobiota bacterium]